MGSLLRKLRHRYIWKRVFYERLTEPLHLNLLSVAVAACGSLRAKIAFDLVLRPHHAFAILKAADQARRLGLKRVTLIEFGVAAGAGLVNMAQIARRITRNTGVEFRIHGFDTGCGMPPPRTYKDHPDLYQHGDFPMDRARLESILPANTSLHVGELDETVPRFLQELDPECPIGFLSIDVDYYYSTKDALMVLEAPAECYLPNSLIYLDDVEDDSHNSYCGELLAVNEFNFEHELRKIERPAFLRSQRIFRNARWIDHIFTLHMLDHPTRQTLDRKRARVELENPYLSLGRFHGRGGERVRLPTRSAHPSDACPK